ncbi:MAG: hypothetical protein Kapaf2KO_09110 [Candidatus Kapaibacteriales bacterium]
MVLLEEFSLNYKMKKILLMIPLILIVASCSEDHQIIPAEREVKDNGTNSLDTTNTFYGLPIPINGNPEGLIISNDEYVYSFDTIKRIVNWVAFEGRKGQRNNDYSFTFNDLSELERFDPRVDSSYQSLHDYGNESFHLAQPLILAMARKVYDRDNYSSFYSTLLYPGEYKMESSSFYIYLGINMGMLEAENKERKCQFYTGPYYGDWDSVEYVVNKTGDSIPIPKYLWAAGFFYESGWYHIETPWNSAIPSSQMFGMLCKNDMYERRKNYQQVEVTVDSIEKLIGYDLFYSMHDSIEEKYESVNLHIPDYRDY